MMNAWLDGELLPDKQAAVDRHLSRCRRCSKEAETLLEITRILDSPPPARPSDTFAAKTLSRFQKEAKTQNETRWWVGMGWGMPAAMAAGALAGLGVGCRMGIGWTTRQLLLEYRISDFLYTCLGSLFSWC